MARLQSSDWDGQLFDCWIKGSQNLFPFNVYFHGIAVNIVPMCWQHNKPQKVACFDILILWINLISTSGGNQAIILAKRCSVMPNNVFV